MVNKKDNVKHKDILVIINPKSGTLTFNKIWEDIEIAFKDENISYDTVLPEHKKNIEDVTRSNLDKKNYDTVVVIGGDGTVSAVARAIINKDVKLCIVPTGTANVIANELGISTKPLEALSLAVSKKSKLKKLNAINANKRNYFLRVSVGLTSIAVKNNSKVSKGLLGRMSYLVSGVKNFFKYYHRHFKINIDGNKMDMEASDVIVTNFQRTFFPLIKLSDNITPDNSKLDVLIFKKLGVYKVFKIAAKSIMAKSTTWKDGDVEHISKAKEIFIDTKSRMPVQGDGDFFGYTPVKIKLIPNAVQVIVP